MSSKVPDNSSPSRVIQVASLVNFTSWPWINRLAGEPIPSNPWNPSSSDLGFTISFMIHPCFIWFGSLRAIVCTALRTQADARRHRHRTMRMKDRTGEVKIVKAVPGEVLFAAHGRSLDPAQAAD